MAKRKPPAAAPFNMDALLNMDQAPAYELALAAGAEMEENGAGVTITLGGISRTFGLVTMMSEQETIIILTEEVDLPHIRHNINSQQDA